MDLIQLKTKIMPVAWLTLAYLLPSLVATHAPAAAQAPPPIMSPEVLPDRRVIFRFRAPNAKSVTLNLEGARSRPMQKGENGVWSITTDPLESDYYGYSFSADGVGLLDPLNSLLKPNLLNTQNMVHVPGAATIPWEANAVPHGEVHHHFYHSAAVGDNRDFFVYTPPGYDASGWTAVGRANVVLDNLIAKGKAKPMLVVMPLGYGAPEIVARNGSPMRDPALSQRNFDKFRDALLNEVIPEVERLYRVFKDRESRAIAGLSMGGGESLFVGLNAVDRFAWIASFSGALMMVGNDYARSLPEVKSSINSRVRRLWIACGTEDFLLNANHSLEDWLKSKNVNFTKIETPGAHTWMVWRRNLAEFAGLIFK